MTDNGDENTPESGGGSSNNIGTNSRGQSITWEEDTSNFSFSNSKSEFQKALKKVTIVKPKGRHGRPATPVLEVTESDISSEEDGNENLAIKLKDLKGLSANIVGKDALHNSKIQNKIKTDLNIDVLH